MQQCFPHYGVDTMARVGLRCVPGPHGKTAMHHNSGHCARQCACELVLIFFGAVECRGWCVRVAARAAGAAYFGPAMSFWISFVCEGGRQDVRAVEPSFHAE